MSGMMLLTAGPEMVLSIPMTPDDGFGLAKVTRTEFPESATNTLLGPVGPASGVTVPPPPPHAVRQAIKSARYIPQTILINDIFNRAVLGLLETSLFLVTYRQAVLFLKKR